MFFNGDKVTQIISKDKDNIQIFFSQKLQIFDFIITFAKVNIN